MGPGEVVYIIHMALRSLIPCLIAVYISMCICRWVNNEPSTYNH
jgi:hypothetical protein